MSVTPQTFRAIRRSELLRLRLWNSGFRPWEIAPAEALIEERQRLEEWLRVGRPFIPRNIFRTPAQASVDLRVSRRFRFSESTAMEFLAEAFNLFNRVNVTGVSDTLYTASTTALTLTERTDLNAGEYWFE